MGNTESKWASTQLTQEQAIALAESKEWEYWDAEKKVRTQLFQKRLFLPFDVFHAAINEVLGRPVFTHEFAFRDLLVAEYLGARETPSFQEIIDLIPAHKRIVIGF